MLSTIKTLFTTAADNNLLCFVTVFCLIHKNRPLDFKFYLPYFPSKTKNNKIKCHLLKFRLALYELTNMHANNTEKDCTSHIFNDYFLAF